jgi:hypothetical protein
MRNDKYLVLTAFTTGYDELLPLPEKWIADGQCVAFTDDEGGTPGWEVRSLGREGVDQCRRAKVYKICPHRWFPDVKYSIWIDGSIQVTSTVSLKEFVESSLAEQDLAVFRHRVRDCIYEESEACVRAGKDDPLVMSRQMAIYSAQGFPKKHGLAECCVLVRRHCEEISRFNEAWMAEIEQHSRRDQLSFNFVAQKMKLRFAYMTGKISRNEHFVRRTHKKNSRPSMVE